jgi:hypothetical protein
MRYITFLCLLLAGAAIADEPAKLPVLISVPDAFQTLVNPQCSHCRDEAQRRAKELRDDDRVLCWIRGYSDGGAIPIRFFLNTYRVISDSYGVFVYDPDAGYARGFAPSYDFKFHGWRNGVMVMADKDETLYSCLTGKAFEGPKKGTQLEVVPTLVSDWGEWLKRYPQAVAYHMFDKYKPVELPEKTTQNAQKSRGTLDTRLPAEEPMLGVAHGAHVRAYRLKDIEQAGMIEDTLGDERVAILWNGPTRTAAAYLCLASPAEQQPGAPRPVSLRRDAKNERAPFVDSETGSHWDIAGRAVEGELKGWTLEWLNGTQVKWFAWAAEYPETAIHVSPKSAGKTGATSHEMVLVEPRDVTSERLAAWRGDGYRSLVVALDERFSTADYRSATAIAAAKNCELYYWIEIARNERMADEHPEWMASLGMHDDWRRSFPEVLPADKGHVVKAYPWVPIGYREAFEAHVARVLRLARKVPADYRGLIVNGLQGGPASCGCGNLQCRWALDYDVPATTAARDGDDAASQFIARLGRELPQTRIVPAWVTECELEDLSSAHGAAHSTGLCGSVPCAKRTCPQVFARQWSSLRDVHKGPVALLALHGEFGRRPTAPASLEESVAWVARPGNYLAATLEAQGAAPATPDQLWLVVQGYDLPADEVRAARAAAAQTGAGRVITTMLRLDQSYSPRAVKVASDRAGAAPRR